MSSTSLEYNRLARDIRGIYHELTYFRTGMKKRLAIVDATHVSKQCVCLSINHCVFMEWSGIVQSWIIAVTGLRLLSMVQLV